MKRLVVAASLSVLVFGQALADEATDEAGLGTCTTSGNRKICRREVVTNADNCEPQPDCRAQYTQMETVSVTTTVLVNGHVVNSFRRFRRPIQTQ